MNSVQKRRGKSGFGLTCDVLLFTIPFIFSVITACYGTQRVLGHAPHNDVFNCSSSRNVKTAFMAPAPVVVVFFFFFLFGYIEHGVAPKELLSE